MRTPAPVAASSATLETAEAQEIVEADLAGFIGARPADYSFNNAQINAAGVQAAGNVGAGVVVAVIDSGTTNAPVVPALAGTVIGGESFVAGDTVGSATSRRNGPHGTWVGTVIAGHANFLFANTSTLVRSLRLHAPSSVIACTPALGCPATASIVPMIGVAPAAKIYALKVFPSTADSTSTSTIVAAMDRAITLRRNFNRGMPSVPVSGDGSEDHPFVFDSLKIDVVNMSIGGVTLFAGRELDEQLTVQMLAAGIAPAISAGNEGFGAMTASGPGDGMGALDMAAANEAAHERVLRDVQFGLGIGALYRPTTHTQTADFSSRGPTADGRLKPDLTANGYATYAQGTCQGNGACNAGTGLAPISLVSGTSFSAPTAAGALALVRAAAPTAFAINVRNALIESANPSILGDGSGRIDQGRGFLDVAAAIARLASGNLSFGLDFSNPGDTVRDNVRQIGFRTVPLVDGSPFSAHVSNLLPGQVAQFFVRTEIDDTLTVAFKNVTPENAPANQNLLFGDDLQVTILDAITSTNAPLLQPAFINADGSITTTASPGLVRVAIQGDWTTPAASRPTWRSPASTSIAARRRRKAASLKGRRSPSRSRCRPARNSSTSSCRGTATGAAIRPTISILCCAIRPPGTTSPAPPSPAPSACRSRTRLPGRGTRSSSASPSTATPKTITTPTAEAIAAPAADAIAVPTASAASGATPSSCA